MLTIKLFGAACSIGVALLWSGEALAQNGKEAAPRKAVRCCGLMLRTDFGHYERLAEMGIEPDLILSNCIDSGKTTGLVEAFESYLKDVDKEFGDSEHRDVIRTRLLEVFKSVENDSARGKQLMAAFKEFSFASILEARGLKERSIEQVRKSRASFLKAVPPDSFCVMPIELYLATALTENGSATEAITVAQSVASRSKNRYGKRDEFTGSAFIALGRAQLKAGNAAVAEQALREGIAIVSEAPEIQPTTYLLHCSLLAETLLEEKKYQETVELMDYLEPQIRKLTENQPAPPLFSAVMMRAKALIGLNRLNDAEKALGRFPETVQSLRSPGVEGRNLLEVAADLCDANGNSEQAATYRKWIARFDSRNENSARR